jgi:hypothetical protein
VPSLYPLKSNNKAIVLPEPVIEPIKRQIEQLRIIHEGDISEGFGEEAGRGVVGVSSPLELLLND